MSYYVEPMVVTGNAIWRNSPQQILTISARVHKASLTLDVPSFYNPQKKKLSQITISRGITLLSNQP